MAEEKSAKRGSADSGKQSEKEVKPKSSRKWYFCCGIILLFIIAYFVIGFLVANRHSSSTKTTPAPAKNYQFHEPSAEVANRQIDCMSLVYYRVNKKNALCLNLYQTSAEDIQGKLSASNYDRVIVYGEKTIFDGNPNTGMTDFSSKFYRVAKFSDQITLPKLMEYYGVENLDYITKEFAPYPAIYYYIDTADTIAKSCSSDALGCALAHFGALVNDQALENQTNTAYFLARPNTQDTIRLAINKPSDCYTNFVLIHETGHVLSNANQSTLQGSQLSLHYAPIWFDEAHAELAGTLGLAWVCGQDTVKTEECTINGKNDKNCDLIKFNSVFPPSGTHTKFPKGNNCELAMIDEFYKFLGSGDLKTQYSQFFIALRAKTKNENLSTDEAFISFLINLSGNNQSVKDNLSSHGCSF
jgi:hypothetical protein